MKVIRLHTGMKLSKAGWAATLTLCMVLLTGVFAPFIATSKPWYIKNNNQVYFPVFSARKTYELRSRDGRVREYPVKLINWSKFDEKDGNVRFGLIPYDAGASDLLNANFQPPLSRGDCPKYPEGTEPCDPPFIHWLGTNLKGEDVLSGLIHGTSLSLRIGFFSMFMAFFIGIVLGILAGYMGNTTLKVPVLSGMGLIGILIPVFYYSQLAVFLVTEVTYFPGWLKIMVSTGCILALFFLLAGGVYFLGSFLQRAFRWNKKMYIPVDRLISGGIDLFASVPKLMLVVALAAIMERGVYQVVFIIGISSWAGVARLVRSEAQKLRSNDFITSARALGLTHFRIMWKHILPNIRVPLLVSFVFGVSGAILVESGLSFLNIGVPENVITWGRLLADGRQNFNAWWLILFPGLAVCITTLCLNVLGEELQSGTYKD